MFFLRTLGRFSLEQTSDGSPILANQRKALALLAVLATSRSAVSRDRLMALLWSESDDVRARGSLKQLLHLIRRQVGRDDVIDGLAELRLNRDVITNDVEQFRSAVHAGDDHVAIALYGGPFLDSVFIDGAAEFERWTTSERDGLARQFAESLERLALAATAGGRIDEAVVLWRRLQDTDPTNGRLAVGLMAALNAGGDRAGAIRHARVHQALLHEELGAPAEPRVMNYADELLRVPANTRQLSPAGPGDTPLVTAVHSPAQTVIAIDERAPDDSATGNVDIASAQSVAIQKNAQYRNFRRYVLSALAVVTLLVAGWVYSRQSPSQTDDNQLQPGRVAVAVLVNRTNDPKLDAVGMMASDWLTRGLSRLPAVDVVEAGGLYLRGHSQSGDVVDPIQMARSNGASVVVAGNYYYRNVKRDSITFSTQVIDVVSGRVERALEPVSASINEPIAALDELRQRVSSALSTLLDPRTIILNTPLLLPPRLDAYSEFLAGQEVYWQGDWESSLPYFRRAARLDSTFYTAAAFISVAGIGTGRCELVDSVAREFDRRRDRIPELDVLTVQSSKARCESDMAEHHRLQRRRIELIPGSKFLQLWLATSARMRNLPAEARATLANINPSRDLGWLNERGRSFFWREVAASDHMLSDPAAERQTAERMKRAGGTALAYAYFTARSMAEEGKADSALLILQSVKSASNDPALLSGLTNGRLNAVYLATPGWVMFQTALELLRSEETVAANTAADMAIAWFEAKGPEATLPAEQQWVLAQCFMFRSRLDDAQRTANALVKAQPGSVEFRGLAGVVAARRHDNVAVTLTEQWLMSAKGIIPVGAPLLYRAQIAALQGDTANAMRLIELLPHGIHPYDFIQFHIEPAFRSLYAMPRFQRFLLPKG
ncbi:MAG: BTAD domain-containing putative transcriptional regulator [Gemmatimonadaceae bacterium]